MIAFSKNFPLKEKHSLIRTIMAENGRYFQTFRVNKAEKKVLKIPFLHALLKYYFTIL